MQSGGESERTSEFDHSRNETNKRHRLLEFAILGLHLIVDDFEHSVENVWIRDFQHLHNRYHAMCCHQRPNTVGILLQHLIL